MKQRMLVLVLFTVLGISCDPSSPDVTAAGENFLPLASGNTWEYDVHVVGGGIDTTQPATVTMSGPFTFDSVTWYGVNNFCVARKTSSPLPIFCAAWGLRGNQALFFQQGPGPALFDPEVVLDFPLWVGKSWLTKPSVDTSYVISGGDTIVSKFLSRRTYRGRSSVVVSAGSFPCIEIADSTYDAYAQSGLPAGTGSPIIRITRTTEWYAKGVGLVKQVIETILPQSPGYNKTETRSLTKYTVKGS